MICPIFGGFCEKLCRVYHLKKLLGSKALGSWRLSKIKHVPMSFKYPDYFL